MWWYSRLPLGLVPLFFFCLCVLGRCFFVGSLWGCDACVVGQGQDMQNSIGVYGSESFVVASQRGRERRMLDTGIATESGGAKRKNERVASIT